MEDGDSELKVSALANTAFASTERLSALNLNAGRSFLEDNIADAKAKALFGIKDPQQPVRHRLPA